MRRRALWWALGGALLSIAVFYGVMFTAQQRARDAWGAAVTRFVHSDVSDGVPVASTNETNTWRRSWLLHEQMREVRYDMHLWAGDWNPDGPGEHTFELPGASMTVSGTGSPAVVHMLVVLRQERLWFDTTLRATVELAEGDPSAPYLLKAAEALEAAGAEVERIGW